MRIAYLLFIPLLFGFISAPADRSIDPEEFDVQFLEQLVHDKINELRIQKKRIPLISDSILYVSAQDHSAYLIKLGKLSHLQSGDKSMKTPQDRAEYYGIEGYWVGENILYSYYNSNVDNGKNGQFKTYTYEILAEAILHSWKTSSSHLANILNPEYTLSGLALAVDFETKRVYVCQDFAKAK
ncbi:MAG: CAP domain-containing protein [Crocinitomicaceae bacterium]